MRIYSLSPTLLLGGSLTRVSHSHCVSHLFYFVIMKPRQREIFNQSPILRPTRAILVSVTLLAEALLSRERSRVPPMPGLKRGNLAGLRPPRVHPISTRMRCTRAIAAHEAHKLRCTVREHLEVVQRQNDCMKVLPSCLRGLEAWTSSGYHRKSNHIAHLSRLVVQVEPVAWDGCTPRIHDAGCSLAPDELERTMSEPVSRSSATSSNMPHAVPKYRIVCRM